MKQDNKTRLFAFLTIIWLAAAMVLAVSEPVSAQGGTAAQVLAEINGLRAANGRDPLAENQYLNIAAQQHANWIAAGNPGGHTGAGGSTPTDRARAVGYDGTATENWARGSWTASEVVYTVWANSGPHINNMLTTRPEFGAGVAVDGSGLTIYVVKFGTPGTWSPPPASSAPSGPTPTSGPFINLVSVATPNPDGSVIHVVQYGHTLWKIVNAYEIEMSEMLALNYLTEDTVIYPDQELIIVPPDENYQEDEDAEAPEPTPSPTFTLTPAPTVTRTLMPTAEPTPTEVPPLQGNILVNIFSGDTMGVGIGLVVVSLFGIGLLLFTTSRLK